MNGFEDLSAMPDKPTPEWIAMKALASIAISLKRLADSHELAKVQVYDIPTDSQRPAKPEDWSYNMQMLTRLCKDFPDVTRKTWDALRAEGKIP